LRVNLKIQCYRRIRATYFIGSLECFGSLLLIVGLASQPLSLLISVSMMVAYITADFEAPSNFLNDSDKLVEADPFPFLLTALILYIFGPGEFSADAVLKRKLTNSVKEKGATCDPRSRPVK
jgi:putative oxidoreductase